MRSIIEFFVKNPKFNYTLFVVCFLLGIWSYQNMPKEMFPSMESDVITISGGYSGASINTLDKIIVNDLESEILGIDKVKEIESTVKPGSFSIYATLKDGVDKKETLDEIERTIKLTKTNLPSDMNDPSAIVVKRVRPIIYVGLGSKTKTKQELIDKVEDIKNQITTIEGISDTKIYGNNDSIIEFVLEEKKINTYGLKISQITNVLSNLSYTFPIGNMKDTENGYYYLSMNAGNKSIEEYENTILNIGNKEVYLKDIVKVQSTFKEDSSKAYINGKPSIIMTVNQLETANGIKLVQLLNKEFEKIRKQNPEYELTVYNDRSVPIKKRLNVVFSNIAFGMILVILALYILINKRLSLVIGLGIPTSFVLAFIFANYWGMSINVVSLLGILIALGIVVDDAIVVGENIQRHIEKGEDKKKAAIDGVMEVIGPVTMASLTTLFAFIPMLLISGQMGKFIMLIPIMVSVLLIASLIEVFIFLPIHAEHMLDKKDKVLSWEPMNKIYEKILIKIIHFKKTFLVLFFILVPLFTFYLLQQTSFQMFPRFDASEFKISGKFPDNNNLEQTANKLEEVHNYLDKVKEKYDIKSYTTKVGYKTNVSGSSSTGENMFTIDIELAEMKEQNVFEKYVNPLFEIEEVEKGNRKFNSKKISKEVLSQLNKLPIRKEMEELNIIQRKVGPVKTDIHLSVNAQTSKEIIESIERLEKELNKINGVTNISNDLSLGIPEIKIKINKYGESLGLTERDLGRTLSNLYLENKKFNIFTDKEMLEVNFVTNEEDNLNKLKNKEITLPNGKEVVLNEVVDFIQIDSFLKIVKMDGIITKNLYANVDSKIITATEVLNQLQPMIKTELEKGIKVKQKGENERKKELAADMQKAVALTMFLIILAMLYMFKDFGPVFIVVSVIPFSVIGALLGHMLMGMNLTMPSVIGILGLAGVVINDAILMLSFIQKSKNVEEFMVQAKLRFRPIILTSVTTLLGLSTLIFFATGQAKILQPIAVSLGYGLLWGTIINLLYVPVLYALLRGYKK